MLEESPSRFQATRQIELSPYPVDEKFQGLSYAKRYEIVCQRMVREMLYDAACFLTSNAEDGRRGKFNQPNIELSIKNFAISLHARAAAFAKIT